MDWDIHLSSPQHSYYYNHPTNTAVLTHLFNIIAHLDNFISHWSKQRKLLTVGGDCPGTLAISVPAWTLQKLVNQDLSTPTNPSEHTFVPRYLSGHGVRGRF